MVVCEWWVVDPGGEVLFVGGGWLFMIGYCHLWMEGHHLWWGVVIHGWSFVDGCHYLWVVICV